MSGLGLVAWCLVLDLLTGAALPPDGIRAIACCDQGVHPISGHCTRSDRVQCSLTGAAFMNFARNSIQRSSEFEIGTLKFCAFWGSANLWCLGITCEIIGQVLKGRA